jgi:hypothetical protein
MGPGAHRVARAAVGLAICTACSAEGIVSAAASRREPQAPCYALVTCSVVEPTLGRSSASFEEFGVASTRTLDRALLYFRPYFTIEKGY